MLLGYCDDSYRQYLAGLAESLGVASNLVILPPVPYDEVASYVGDADCGHALYEPSNINHRFATTASNKLMEHMAAGIPSIVSDTPDLRRLVLDRGCGLVADVTALKVIAHAVNQVLEDPEARARMGSAARSVFVNELCYDRQLAPYMERLSGLVRRRGGNSRRETTA